MALHALLGRKLKMTQLWNDKGEVMPVTVIQAGPCQVVQVKSKESKDGYQAVQLGFEDMPARNDGKGTPRANKPTIGHFKKNNAAPKRYVREVRWRDGDKDKLPEPGSTIKVDAVFQMAQLVDVIGTSKGHGFAGVVKRHHFSGGFRSHGSKSWRDPGSVSSNQCPGRLWPGKRLGGHMGDVRRTVRNLEVIKIEPEHDLLYVKGGVPGPTGGYLFIEKAKAAKPKLGGAKTTKKIDKKAAH
jgi:large subunit ribosomal protein L3